MMIINRPNGARFPGNTASQRYFPQLRNAILPLLLILVLPLLAIGQTNLKTTVGWGDALRTGRWTPIFITVADAQIRSVILEVAGTSGTSAAIIIRQRAAAQPRPTTYSLLYPLNGDLSHTQVTVRDEATGKTLATQPLKDFNKFTAAGQTPVRELAPDDTLIGISGNITSALQLKTQLARANLPSGILNDIQLPAAAVGYEGINALILIAPDLHNIDAIQQQAILDWIRAGGNLVLIPSSDPLPQCALLDALPCDIGPNLVISPGLFAVQSSTLNSRELHPRNGAQSLDIFGPGAPAAFAQPLGLGVITVLPADISPLDFPNNTRAIALWQSVFAGRVDVHAPRPITTIEIGDAQEDVLRTGPRATDTIGRGPEETIALRNLLPLLNASKQPTAPDWPALLLSLAALCAILGPLDSIVLLRLGHPPRNWLTVIGWLGLLGSLIGWATIRVNASAQGMEISTFQLIDQAASSTVARTDVVAILSPKSSEIPLSLENEWWEPANQCAVLMNKDRFVEIICHEDQQSCKPGQISMRAGDSRSLRGEIQTTGPGLIEANLSIRKDAAGNAVLSGELTNRSKATMTDIQIATSAGALRIPQPTLAPGSSLDINGPLSPAAITFVSLPADIPAIAPDQTSRIENLLKTGGFACIYCQARDAEAPNIAEGPSAGLHLQLLRAVVPLTR
ncbi:MAG: hypothetical protein M3O30_10945 [Planctomycetota bacterium]|nr:hypothetical protein [Planctomycetota bacterium]